MIGFAIGVIIGGTIGFVAAALLAAGRNEK